MAGVRDWGACRRRGLVGWFQEGGSGSRKVGLLVVLLLGMQPEAPEKPQRQGLLLGMQLETPGGPRKPLLLLGLRGCRWGCCCCRKLLNPTAKVAAAGVARSPRKPQETVAATGVAAAGVECKEYKTFMFILMFIFMIIYIFMLYLYL